MIYKQRQFGQHADGRVDTFAQQHNKEIAIHTGQNKWVKVAAAVKQTNCKKWSDKNILVTKPQ